MTMLGNTKPFRTHRRRRGRNTPSAPSSHPRQLRRTTVFVLVSFLFAWLLPWIGCCGLQQTNALNLNPHASPSDRHSAPTGLREINKRSLTQLHRHAPVFVRQRASTKGLSMTSSTTDDSTTKADNEWVQTFPSKLVRSLDLHPLMKRVAAHAATRRGKEALMAVVEGGWSEGQASRRGGGSKLGPLTSSLSPRRRAWLSSPMILDSSVDLKTLTSQLSPHYKCRILTSLQQVRDEYDRVEQATLVLQGWNNLSFPSLYGSNEDDDTTRSFESSPWSADFEVNSDDDDWLHHQKSEDFTLEDIFQAQQVVQMLVTVFDWASQENVVLWSPSLASLCRQIDRDALALVLNSIQGAVEILRVRSVTDPNAHSTFQFQLNETKYPALGLLTKRARELEMQSKANLGGHVSDLVEEIQIITREIQQSLSQSTLKCRQVIHQGLNVVAELDVIFSKAAFGVAVKAQFPRVQDEGCIHVEQFIHPLLIDDVCSCVVPNDLRMCKDRRVLTISGMNGGGKTVALKSFGVAACLTRLGIPIPSLSRSITPRVDYFDCIMSAVGDDQDMTRGESTFTSQLSSYSTILDTVSKSPERSYLILMDELGAGTDVNAGGAIAQAILERLLLSLTCRSVVTTHSSRLKALSFESSDFECAAVLRSTPNDDSYGNPIFQLQYGVIGESYAIGAAARCAPSFPSEVFDRAIQLASEFQEVDGIETSASASYVRSLTRSLDKQLQLAEQSRLQAQFEVECAAKCRQAMQALARAYDRHLGYQLNRVEVCYQRLKAESDDSLYIAGDTLRELQVMRKQVKSQIDLLRDQGLKFLPESYILSDGEGVVVVDDGMWNGLTGNVKLSPNSASSDLATDEVVVVMSLNPFDEFQVMEAASANSEEHRSVVFKRSQLAIWDYDSVWDTNSDPANSPITSIEESRRRLSEVLKSAPSSRSANVQELSPSGSTSVYKSSRERKAAKSKRKKR